MNRIAALLAILLSPLAFSQTLNIREINRTANVYEDSTVDDVKFYSGEYVTFVARMVRGNTTVSIPSDAVPVWKAWVDGTPGTLYINATGTVVNGQAVVKITPAQSNITAGEYKFQIGVTDAAGNRFGIAAQGDLEILFASPGGASYVGTTDVFREVLAGTNITIATNGNNRTISASASGVTDGDKGDVTVTASGATWTIDAGAVTLAKMADLATSHIIGRHGGGTGAPQAIAIDGGLELSGANLRRAALTGDVTASAGSNATTLAASGVTAGSYTAPNLTIDAKGRITAASSRDYLLLAGGSVGGGLWGGSGDTTLNALAVDNEVSIVSAGDKPTFRLYRPSNDAALDISDILFNHNTGGTDKNAVKLTGAVTEGGSGIFRIGISDGATVSTIATVTGDGITANSFLGSGSGLTNLDATDLVGDIPAASFGEERLEFRSSDFELVTSEQVGYAQYVLTSGSPANALSTRCAKSANTSEQDFVWRSVPIVVPRGFVAFKTTGAIDIDWVSDDSTNVADIRGIRLVRYVGATPSTLYTDSTTRNVSGANTPTNISIDRSAFTATTVSAGDHLVLEITCTVEDSKCLAILHTCIHSE